VLEYHNSPSVFWLRAYCGGGDWLGNRPFSQISDLHDLDLDLASGHTVYRRVSLIDLPTCQISFKSTHKTRAECATRPHSLIHSGLYAVIVSWPWFRHITCSIERSKNGRAHRVFLPSETATNTNLEHDSSYFHLPSLFVRTFDDVCSAVNRFRYQPAQEAVGWKWKFFCSKFILRVHLQRLRKSKITVFAYQIAVFIQTCMYFVY